MWRTVLLLEWRILRRDKSARAILALFGLFLMVAALAGGRYAADVNEGLDRLQANETARIAQVEKSLKTLAETKAPAQSKDPRDPVWMGKEGIAPLLVFPPAPLAPIAVGQRDLQPQALRVNTEVHLNAERETETAMSGPTRLMTGAFDLAFLFVVLFPLMVITLSYELLSGERERGTLAMLLAQPITLRTLVLGKAAARALGLSAVTILLMFSGLMLAGVDLTAGQAWGPISLLMLTLVAWAFFWFAAAVAVNALGKSSATNALLLVGVWLVLVIIVPGLVHVSANVLHPPPSSLHVLHESRKAAQDAEAKLMGLTGTHEKKAKPADFAQRVVEVQAQLAQRLTPVLQANHHQQQERQRLMGRLQFLSPALLLQNAMEDVAGAGQGRYRLFDEQADVYHKAYRAHLFEMIRAGHQFNPENLKSVPYFDYVEEPFDQVVGRVAGTILFFLGLAVALLLIALPGFRRIGRLTN